MRQIMQPLRVLAVILMILTYLAYMAIIGLLFRERWSRTRLANRILTSYSRFALWLLNVKAEADGIENLLGQENALLVGNHLSYVDVLVVASFKPSCFVTSVEVRETPGLGLICQMAGCLFVERRSKKNILNEVAEITEGLERGLTVAIFPESTSTNGEQVLRFKRPLYLSAIQSGKAIVPFCLNYHTVGGKPIDRKSRDSIFWYGDMDFVPHLWSLAGSGGVKVQIQFLPAILPDKTADSAALAEVTHSMVEKAFQPVRH